MAEKDEGKGGTTTQGSAAAKARDLVVTEEVAELDFERFMELADVDMTDMDDEDRQDFGAQKRRLIRAITRGDLAIDEKGQPILTTKSGDTVTFYEMEGADLISMDTKKRNRDIAKMYAVMASMTKKSSGYFSKLKGRDIKLCNAIVILFLA